jgi:hypothetical protein
MRKKQAGNSVELEHQYCEMAREVYQTIHTSGLGKFSFSLIDSLWNDLNAIVNDLERLPEAACKQLLEVIQGLSAARNELRLARFLFELPEINEVQRLVMRNRAILRGENILHRVMAVWPLQSSS